MSFRFIALEISSVLLIVIACSLQDPNVKLIRDLRAEIQRLKTVVVSGDLVLILTAAFTQLCVGSVSKVAHWPLHSNFSSVKLNHTLN